MTMEMGPFSKSAYILRSLFLFAVEQSDILIIGRYHVISNTRQNVAITVVDLVS